MTDNWYVNSTRMALHGNLASVLLRLGDPDSSVRECTRGLELADAHPDTCVLMDVARRKVSIYRGRS